MLTFIQVALESPGLESEFLPTRAIANQNKKAIALWANISAKV
ncbi:hypothetical protein [Microcoleus sp. N3A4]